MKRFIYFAFIACCVASASASEVTIALTLRPAQILPGTSAGFHVVVSNHARENLILSNRMALEVTDGDLTFLATRTLLSEESEHRPIPWEFLIQDADADEISSIVIPAGTEFEFSVPFNHGMTFFQDERLSMPGRRQLRLGMVTPEAQSFWSQAVTLNVRQPEGVDLEVWNRMLEISKGHGFAWSRWTKPFRYEVWTQYRNSGYAPHAAGLNFLDHPDWQKIREYAIAGPYRNDILLADLDAPRIAVIDAIERRDRAKALDAQREYRARVEAALELSDDPLTRIRAQRVLDKLMSPDEVIEAVRSIEGNGPKKVDRRVQPIVRCVSPLANSQWTAFFGYTSKFEEDVTISAKGGENKLEPQPHYRGQPELFKACGEQNAFFVVFDGDSLTWFVRGKRATASFASKRCTN